jgi:hypothetical protein
VNSAAFSPPNLMRGVLSFSHAYISADRLSKSFVLAVAFFEV